MRRKISARTARILAYLAIIASFATVALVSVSSASDASTTPHKRHVPIMERTLEFPRCSDASGRWDNNCWYRDKANGTYLNLNYGEWTYVLANGDMIHNAHKR